MVDVDPGLDTKLRAFFDHIEASTPPSALADITTSTPTRRRRTINVVAGLAAVAVVAASITLFAVELGTHRGPAKSSLPASAAQLKRMPLLGNGGIPKSAHVLIPLTRGHGSARLKTFVPAGELLLQLDCAGPGSFKITSTNGVVDNTVEHCSTSSGVTTLTAEGNNSYNGKQCPSNADCGNGYDDKPLTLEVEAAPATSWEILVAETTVWFPQLPPVQPDYQVLVPLTYGAGSITLPTFSVAPDEYIRASIICNAGASGDSLQIAPNPLWPNGQQVSCLVFNSDGSITVNEFGPAVPNSGTDGLGPISLQLEAGPSVNWQVEVTAGPSGIILPELGNQGPVTQSVGVAPASMGTGSEVLPSFTTDKDYTMAFSCAGAGSLTITIGGVPYVATTQCGGHTGWFTPPNQVPGQPLSLSVEASPSVAWEIQPEQVYGSTWGAGGPNMSNNS
jgi:hypothetical protein